MDDISIKVSVIIPIYNVEQYLKQCIDSVISQTLKEIEIICVNDGSTDQSAEILKYYEKKDSRLTVYSKPNAGYGHTINYGLDRSHGKYISIVESDDFIDEKGIELLYDYAEKNQADYVRSNYFEYSNGKNYINDSLKQFSYDKVISANKYPELFLLMPCQPWGSIYKKSFLLHNNIRMNETPGASYQDISWTFVVLSLARKIVFMEKAFYHYRIDNPESSINNQKKVFCMLDEKKYIEAKLIEYQISDPHIFMAFIKLIYVSYKENYERISDEFQYAFLLEWKKEILNQLSNGYLKKEYFEEKQWEEINDIIYNTEKYFEKTAKTYMMKEVYANVINGQLYYGAFVEKLLYNEIIIFGTGTVAKEIVSFLEEKKAMDNIICFCESYPTKTSFYGKKVYSIKNIPYSKNTLFLCAVLEKTQNEIVSKLYEIGFTNIISVDKGLRRRMLENKSIF